ncbi:MAG TPA: hypothetical protein VKT75_14775 [Acidobacteriaceae bacterium]|nr:hypothetical protein [Acidobacteriaceae bacterium]
MHWLALIVLSSFAGGLYAENSGAPPLLIDAASCLVNSKDDWLGVATNKPAELEMGYVVDHKSQMVYLVNFDDEMHTSGTVVAFVPEGGGRHRTLHFQYKVKFRQPEDGGRTVVLTGMPYGGIGTRDHILHAIYDIGYSTYRIPMSDVGTHPEAACQNDAPRE